MLEKIQQIAMRVRELREIAGLSVETLAKEFKIPAQRYEAYESGKVDIPVSFLHKISNRFNVELTALLTGKNPRLHIYSLVRKGQGVSVERCKQYKYQSLGYNFIHKKAEPFLVTVDPEPENASIPLFSHPGQEFHYLLEGKLKVLIDDHEIILDEGDSLIFDANYKHGIKALDNKPAQFLAVIA